MFEYIYTKIFILQKLQIKMKNPTMKLKLTKYFLIHFDF